MYRRKIVGLLLLVAFIAPMGFNGLAFAESKPWKKKINGSKRWQLVLGGAAVYDKETGLVWEREPSFIAMDWDNAISHCYTREIGGRKGWRLPTVEELASLVDTTQSNPALPAGHPFHNDIQFPPISFWSATTVAGGTSSAWVVDFGSGTVFSLDKSIFDLDTMPWCVRGGHGHDGQ